VRSGEAAARRGGARRAARASVRPTVVRVREALFNALASHLPGARVLDLYAGSGALGLGALRRGAARAVLVERDRRQAAVLRRRVRQEGWGRQARVWQADAVAAVRRLADAGERFDLVVMDPPYGRGLLRRTLEAVAASDVLAPGGVVVAEGHWRDRPGAVAGLRCTRESRYGETRVWYFQKAEGSGDDGGGVSGQL
jgi:16S rRNA (guanine966-N2)-methyltransferase